MSPLALTSALIVAGITLSAIMAAAWAVEQYTANASWIDCGWTFAVGLVSAGASVVPIGAASSGPRQLVVATLIAAWCARLAWHLLQRALRGADDPRYADLRRQWGASTSRRMYWFAQAQAVAAIPLVLAVLLAAHRSGAWPDWQDTLGAAVLLVGIAGAGISDWQLRRFAAEASHRDMVCDVGLWRWSRHPNYFFEWLGWVGFAAIAVDFSEAFACGWLAVLAPAMMYWLLVHVSGIPLLEQHLLRTRGDAYRAYQQRTSMFIPLPPVG